MERSPLCVWSAALLSFSLVAGNEKDEVKGSWKGC